MFLSVPPRPAKPREAGLTHVLDKGLPLASLSSLLASTAAFVDVWKFGWGTAYVDPQAAAKIAVLREHGVKTCPGGTLLEIAWSQARVCEYWAWARHLGFDCVEVSDGATGLDGEAKRQLIRQACAEGFEVLAEVGSKDPSASVAPAAWIREIRADLAAGATWIVTEGRESGTVGLYRPDGTVRADLVAALRRTTDAAKLIYEAPQRTQQAWLIRQLGPDVNLGNVATDEIMSVESLRLGLRADTIGIATRPFGAVADV